MNNHISYIVPIVLISLRERVLCKKNFDLQKIKNRLDWCKIVDFYSKKIINEVTNGMSNVQKNGKCD